MNIDTHVEALLNYAESELTALRSNDLSENFAKAISAMNSYGFKHNLGDYVVKEINGEIKVGIIKERARKEIRDRGWNHYLVLIDGKLVNFLEKDLLKIMPAKTDMLKEAISDFIKKLNEIQKIQEPENEQQ